MLPTAFGDANGIAIVLGAVPQALGASLKCPGDAFGRLLAALGSPGTPQDRLRADVWAFKNHPERVSTRPRSALGHPKRPNADLGSIRDGFPSIFGGFFREKSNIVLSCLLYWSIKRTGKGWGAQSNLCCFTENYSTVFYSRPI